MTFLNDRRGSTGKNIVLILSLLLNVVLASMLFLNRMESAADRESSKTAGKVQEVTEPLTVTPGEQKGESVGAIHESPLQPQIPGNQPAEAVQPGQPPAQEAGQPTIAPRTPAPAQASGPRSFCGTIRHSIYETLLSSMDKDEAEVLSAHLSRILMWNFNLAHDISTGDLLRVIYNYDGSDYRTMEVLGLWYDSKALGKRFEAYHFKPQAEKYAGFYDPEGQEIAPRLENGPIRSYEQVTTRLGDGRHHAGVDFKSDVGTAVTISFKAEVLRKNWNVRANGDCLELRYLHDDMHVIFLHLNRIEPGVAPGKVLEAGTKVAESGNTGHTTAPHLHYQLFREINGRMKLVDPFDYHKTFRARLAADQMDAFKKAAEESRGWLNGVACQP